MSGQPEHKQNQDQLQDYLSHHRNSAGSSSTADPRITEPSQPARRLLRGIRDTLLNHLDADSQHTPLGGVGVFHCRQAQALRNVPIHQPLIVLVVSGRKIIALGERRIEVLPGELLLLPGGASVEVGNHPDHQGRPYLGLAMAFSQESIAQFRRSYGSEIPADTQPLWNVSAPMDLVAAMAQWVEWCIRHPVDPTLARHRQVEILMLLARTGVAGNLLLDREASWHARVAQLITLDPARDWSAGEVCRRLGIGESTLRRRLSEEGIGFREVLEESRMVAALALLQETFWPVGQIAEAVGYSSHSRFSERFKRRFGLSPIELKKTRVSDEEQKSSA
ncbi:MAG: helix-turn-helix domain-containing protein [Candidatus Thiodiazotropha lotti]